MIPTHTQLHKINSFTDGLFPLVSVTVSQVVATTVAVLQVKNKIQYP